MTDTEPTQQQIDDFNAAAADYAQTSGKSLDVATRDLGNLLVSLVADPVGTEIFFLKARLDDVEPVIERVEVTETAVSNLAARVAHLEEVGGGVVVGP